MVWQMCTIIAFPLLFNPTETIKMPVINDVTGLNPINVDQIITPKTIKDLQAVLQTHSGPISIGGGGLAWVGKLALRTACISICAV